MSILVVDVGTSGVRAAIVAARRQRRRTCTTARCCPTSPRPASSSSTPPRWPTPCSTWPRAALADGGPVDAVGITNQRASTIVWDRATGEPVGPGIGWQDLRTVGDVPRARRPRACASRPNQSATKVAWLLDTLRPRPQPRPVLRHGRHVDRVDAVGRRAARHRPHQRRASPACCDRDGTRLGRRGARRAATSRRAMLPADRRLDRRARRRPPRSPARRRSPASSATSRRRSSGQGCVRPGHAKITFGTGGMLDVVLGAEPPDLRHARRRRARSRSSRGAATATVTWGVEAIMLSAGTNVEWLRDDLGHHRDAGRVATTSPSQCDDTDGVVYVPALLGLGTPAVGLRRARHAARPHPRHRPARRSCGPCSRASPTAAPTSSRRPRPTPASRSPALRVDGGMSDNPTFVQALADASAAAGRGVARARGDHARRRVPRRAGHRHLGGVRRHRRHVGAAGGRRARTAARPGRMGRGRRPGRGVDSRPVGARLLELPGATPFPA